MHADPYRHGCATKACVASILNAVQAISREAVRVHSIDRVDQLQGLTRSRDGTVLLVVSRPPSAVSERGLPLSAREPFAALLFDHTMFAEHYHISLFHAVHKL